MRPSEYSPDVVFEICAQVADGKALTAVCDESDTLPSFRTVYNWLQTHPEFLQEYARAKQIMAERMAYDIVRIADSADAESYNACRLQVDTRKWLLSKLQPKVYGDAQLLKHADADGNVLKIELSRVEPRPAKIIDVTPAPQASLPAPEPEDTPG